MVRRDCVAQDAVVKGMYVERSCGWDGCRTWTAGVGACSVNLNVKACAAEDRSAIIQTGRARSIVGTWRIAVRPAAVRMSYSRCGVS